MASKFIFAYIGVIGSGKDYSSKEMAENLKCKRIGFSDGVREFTWKFLGWEPADDKEYEEFKYREIPIMVGGARTFVTGRQLLENIATHMRSLDSAYWAKYWQTKAEKELQNSTYVIAHDCRQIEEVEAILTVAARNPNIVVRFIYCNYKSERYEIRDHQSEKFAQRFLKKAHLADITKEVFEVVSKPRKTR